MVRVIITIILLVIFTVRMTVIIATCHQGHGIAQQALRSKRGVGQHPVEKNKSYTERTVCFGFRV